MRRRIWSLKTVCAYKSRGCDWSGELYKRLEHNVVCEKRGGTCKYQAIGCTKVLNIEELAEHELEFKDQHLQLAMDTVVRLVEQVKTLQDEVDLLKNK